jgi:hypothetical protein
MVVTQDDSGAWLPMMAVSNPTGLNPGPTRPQMIRFDNFETVNQERIDATVSEWQETRQTRSLQASLETLGLEVRGVDQGFADEVSPQIIDLARAAVERVLAQNPGSRDRVMMMIQTAGVFDEAIIAQIIGDAE